MSEEWREIPAHPAYQASTLGRIRRTAPVRFSRKHSTVALIQSIDDEGRRFVGIRAGDKERRLSVNTLVASTFIGAKPPRHRVCHLDGDVGNCVVSNLIYRPNPGEICLIGQVFGAWTVLGESGRDANRNRLWLCRCLCGAEKVVGGQHLRYGASKSCGCKSASLRKQSGPEHYGWKGGQNNTGSVAWCSARLGRLRQAAKKNKKTAVVSSVDDVVSLWKESRGKCAICGEYPERTIHLDHDNRTGVVRGFLCQYCNVAIAMAKDSPERLRAIAEYLETTATKCERSAC